MQRRIHEMLVVGFVLFVPSHQILLAPVKLLGIIEKAADEIHEDLTCKMFRFPLC
jgi:hypothetical protein